MGDRSPKDIHKQEVQKQHADEVKEHEKEVVTAEQQHPHSGHPPTEEELKEKADAEAAAEEE